MMRMMHAHDSPKLPRPARTYTLESKNIQGIENGGVVGGGVEGPSPVL